MKSNIIRIAAVGILAGSILFVSSLYANVAFARDNGGRPQGPPPEAYTACEGLSEGDSASRRWALIRCVRGRPD